MSIDRDAPKPKSKRSFPAVPQQKGSASILLALPFYNSMIWQGTGMGNSSCVERITIFVSAARRMEAGERLVERERVGRREQRAGER